MNKHRIMTAAVCFISLSACALLPTAFHSRDDGDTQVAGNVHVSDDKPIFPGHRIECRRVKISGTRIPIKICGSEKIKDTSALLWTIGYPGEGGTGFGRIPAEGGGGGTRD